MPTAGTGDRQGGRICKLNGSARAAARNRQLHMAGQIPVLVVEDSRNMQGALRELIEHFRPLRVVGTVAGETEATQWLHTHKDDWGLAVIDLLLEDGSGFSFLQRCRRERPDGRIVIFSEYASPAIKQRCLDLGADAVFLKSEMAALVHYLERAAAAG